MTIDLRIARERLGWTQADLAKALRMGNQGARTVRRWESGATTVPGPVAVAMEFLLATGENQTMPRIKPETEVLTIHCEIEDTETKLPSPGS